MWFVMYKNILNLTKCAQVRFCNAIHVCLVIWNPNNQKEDKYVVRYSRKYFNFLLKCHQPNTSILINSYSYSDISIKSKFTSTGFTYFIRFYKNTKIPVTTISVKQIEPGNIFRGCWWSCDSFLHCIIIYI